MSQRAKHEERPRSERGLRPVDPWEHPEVRIRARELMRLLGLALRLVWRASPKETVILLATQIVAGLVLPLQVLAGKLALDAILEASRTGGGMEEALPIVIAALVAMTASQIVSVVSVHRQRLLPELAAQKAQELLAAQAVALDLEALETPAFHDRLVRSQHDAVFRPANMVINLALIVSAGVAVFGLAALLFAVHPLLTAGLVLAALPLSWAHMTAGRAYYRHAVRRTPKRRIISYLQALLTMLDSAKETRAFNLGPYLLAEHGRLFNEEMDDFRALVRTRLWHGVLATFASSLVVAGLVLLVLWLHFSGRVSLAEGLAAAGALLLMLPRVNALVANLGQLHENGLFVEDLWSFLEIEPEQRASATGEPVAPTLLVIRAEDLTFRYPNQERPVLDGVSLEIRRGETVALVGENGAGKTTLAKLLCRLYDPDGGRITWDGRDLRTCDPDALREQIAVIFQDFVRYELPARENVGFGDIAALGDTEAIVRAARSADADEFIAELPEGYDTRLGRRFHRGHDLSIGQWQRLALARAFFRDAPLVIMDEPTASLDARAESELFETMRDLFCDRAVLLISHRFSSVRMADRIYVLRDGAIAESGSHDELIAQGGLYAELFGLQAAAYMERPAEREG